MKSAICLLLCAALVSGCVTTPFRIEPVSTPHPVQRATAVTKSLACLGQMYDAYSDAARNGPLIISVRPIVDQTAAAILSGAEIPVEVTAMLKTAVNSISPRVRFASGDHVYQSGESSLGSTIRRMQPDVVIEGGIVEFDRNLRTVSQKNEFSAIFGKGRGEGDASGGRGSETSFSRIALDTVMLDFATQTSIPNVQSSLGVEVTRTVSEGEWAIAVYGIGFGRSHSEKTIAGRHEALRFLVELSVLRTVGRYLKLPYWRCAPDLPEDEAVKSRALADFRRGSTIHQYVAIEELVNYHGHLGIKRDGVYSKADAAAVQAILRDLKVIAPTSMTSDQIWWQLYAALPIAPERWGLVRMAEQASDGPVVSGQLRFSLPRSTRVWIDGVEHAVLNKRESVSVPVGDHAVAIGTPERIRTVTARSDAVVLVQVAAGDVPQEKRGPPGKTQRTP